MRDHPAVDLYFRISKHIVPCFWVLCFSACSDGGGTTATTDVSRDGKVDADSAAADTSVSDGDAIRNSRIETAPDTESGTESDTESGSASDAGGLTCPVDKGNCDNDPINGCEASLTDDPRNCGACGQDCYYGTCKLGKCTDIGIRILIYNGEGTSEGSVLGLQRSLNQANINKLVPGVQFLHETGKSVSKSRLDLVKVLIMPGAESSLKYYIKNTDKVNAKAIKSFVSDGKGYVGFCAGAFAASKFVNYAPEPYAGWGLAAVRSESSSYKGLLEVTMMPEGKKLLGYQGDVTVNFYGGPSMKLEPRVKALAKYKGIETGHPGLIAAIATQYGKGRVILSGPHPEKYIESLGIRHSKWIARSVAWAAGIIE